MKGATLLCGYSALRGGAGLVTLLHRGNTSLAVDKLPELMTQEIAGPLPSADLGRFTSLVLGPGLGQDQLSLALELLEWATHRNLPLVVDAGALSLLEKISCLDSKSQIIATPHPGEAAKLLSTSNIAVERDRIKSAKQLLKLSKDWPFEVTWILKGACPIVAHSEEGIVVCEGGVTTLSVGGSGDVLAGLISSLLQQTQSSFSAALLGVCAHLQAGRTLSMRCARGFMAHEIADEIPKVLF